MTRMTVLVAAAGAILVMSGCGTPTRDLASDATEPAGPSSAGSSSEAAGLPEVTFDPCSSIDDTLLARIGLDPGTKSRNDTHVGDQAVVACNILGDERAVGVIAQNTPWDDIPLTAPADPISVNGREALYVPNSITDDACALLMRTAFGAVVIDTFPMRGGNADPNMHACDGIVDMAAAIEPLIEDGN